MSEWGKKRWASERNLLFSLQAFSTPYVRLFFMDLPVNFLFFSFLLFYFPSLDHARYDIIVARGQQSQYRHRIASKARSTRYLLYVAYTPRVASTVRLVLMCTCLLRARTFTSNLFVVVRFLFTYEISNDGLSLIYWVVVYNWFCCRVGCTIYRNNISPACQEVRDISHVLLVD